MLLIDINSILNNFIYENSLLNINSNSSLISNPIMNCINLIAEYYQNKDNKLLNLDIGEIEIQTLTKALISFSNYNNLIDVCLSINKKFNDNNKNNFLDYIIENIYLMKQKSHIPFAFNAVKTSNFYLKYSKSLNKKNFVNNSKLREVNFVFELLKINNNNLMIADLINKVDSILELNKINQLDLTLVDTFFTNKYLYLLEELRNSNSSSQNESINSYNKNNLNKEYNELLYNSRKEYDSEIFDLNYNKHVDSILTIKTIIDNDKSKYKYFNNFVKFLSLTISNVIADVYKDKKFVFDYMEISDLDAKSIKKQSASEINKMLIENLKYIYEVNNPNPDLTYEESLELFELQRKTIFDFIKNITLLDKEKTNIIVNNIKISLENSLNNAYYNKLKRDEYDNAEVKISTSDNKLNNENRLSNKEKIELNILDYLNDNKKVNKENNDTLSQHENQNSLNNNDIVLNILSNIKRKFIINKHYKNKEKARNQAYENLTVIYLSNPNYQKDIDEFIDEVFTNVVFEAPEKQSIKEDINSIKNFNKIFSEESLKMSLRTAINNHKLSDNDNVVKEAEVELITYIKNLDTVEEFKLKNEHEEKESQIKNKLEFLVNNNKNNLIFKYFNSNKDNNKNIEANKKLLKLILKEDIDELIKEAELIVNKYKEKNKYSVQSKNVLTFLKYKHLNKLSKSKVCIEKETARFVLTNSFYNLNFKQYYSPNLFINKSYKESYTNTLEKMSLLSDFVSQKNLENNKFTYKRMFDDLNSFLMQQLGYNSNSFSILSALEKEKQLSYNAIISMSKCELEDINLNLVNKMIMFGINNKLAKCKYTIMYNICN